jgi:hypothetical protein
MVIVMSPYAIWLLQRMRNTVKKLHRNHIYNNRANIQHVPVLRLHSAQIQPVPLKKNVQSGSDPDTTATKTALHTALSLSDADPSTPSSADI